MKYSNNSNGPDYLFYVLAAVVIGFAIFYTRPRETSFESKPDIQKMRVLSGIVWDAAVNGGENFKTNFCGQEVSAEKLFKYATNNQSLFLDTEITKESFFDINKIFFYMELLYDTDSKSLKCKLWSVGLNSKNDHGLNDDFVYGPIKIPLSPKIRKR